MSKKNHHSTNIPTHLEDDAIIAYLDGELSEEEKKRSSQHLEKCWACRGNLKIIQDSIDNFMNQRQDVLIPTELPPSAPALKLFQERLQNYQSSTQSASVFSFSSRKLKSTFINIRSAFYSFSPATLRAGIALLAVIVIAALILNQTLVTTVSASELLKNADDARKHSLSNTSEPVIHQKIQIRRAKNNRQIDSVNLETWEDTNRKIFRQAIEKDGSRRLILGSLETQAAKVLYISENERPLVLTELAQILQLNRMNPNNPLSAASFKAWRDSLSGKNETVSHLEDGTESYQLKVVPAGESSNGQIIVADYSVHATDWTPLKLRLEVKKEGETLTFEIVRQTSEVVALQQVSPEIFPPTQLAKLPNVTTSPKGSPSLTPSPAVVTNTNPAPTVKPENIATRVPASAELEIEVLQAMNQVKADMGEQIEVKRTADGYVVVSGIIETAERKTEILNSLHSIANHPSVKIEIETVAEAVAKDKQTSNKKNSPVTSIQGVEIQNSTIAAEPQLREYFGRQGGSVDDAVHKYAASRVAQSRQAMQHLGALKKLANQFTPEELKTLKPEAREKWLALIRSHATAFQEQSATLRRELQPVFFAGAGEGSKGSGISNEAELLGSIRQLYAAGAANDSIIRSAFTTSGSGAGVSAIGAPQVWQSLKDAEGLAQRIQTFR